MRKLRALLFRFISLFRKNKLEEELSTEMESHLQFHIEDNLRAGMSPDEARRQALLRLGGIEQSKEAYRERRGLPMIEIFLQDLRFALRILRKNLSYTTVAVLTLALGIGANTAIFSFVNGVLLRPLPYPSPGQLVRVFSIVPDQPHFPVPLANFKDYAAQNHVFSSVALFAERDLDLGTRDQPEHLAGMGVSSGYFNVLGYAPGMGRDFTADEEYKDKNHVIILSDHLWRNRFAASADIVGKNILLSGESYTVVGVMQPGVQNIGGDFHALPDGDTVDFWWPLTLGLTNEGCDRGCHYLNMVARLKPGITVAQATSEMNVLTAAIVKDHPDTAYDKGVAIVPLKEELVGRARIMLLVLLGAVAFLLLIACVNVANLSLARSAARSREVALRAVLGANRWRILRQLFTESLLLSLLGAALGLLLAVGGVTALVALSPDKLPRLHAIHIDASVLGFTAIVTITTALLFGLAPALAILRTDMNHSLKNGDRATTAGSSRTKLQNFLVTSEIALALVLLTGAGLLMRTFINLQHVDMGFQPKDAYTAKITLPEKRYPERADFVLFYKKLTAKIAAMPGVQLVGEGSDIPWTGYDENSGFEIVGRPERSTQGTEARYHFASPNYFQAVGIPLVSGRFFLPTDDSQSKKIVMVNYTFARRYFPGEDAVGKKLNMWGREGLEIVGVVGDVRDSPDAVSVKPSLYWDDWQFPQPDERVLVIRTQPGATLSERSLAAEVIAVDKDVAITAVKPLSDVADHAVSSARFTLILVGSFAALALLLAGVGIFGVMSCIVSQRTQEIGIRMALGAQREEVLQMIVARGSKLAAIGISAGLAISLFLTKAISVLLFGVKPFDLATLVGVALLLAIVALLACYIPARRAARVDPMVALRYE